MEVSGVISTDSRLIGLEDRLMTLPPEPSYREIPLTKGQVCIVDAADYESLTQWSWHARWDNHAQAYYAARVTQADKKKTVVWIHRLLLGLQKGDRRHGDHINGHTLDNRRCNLRITDFCQSSQNRGLMRNNKSGHKGVRRVRMSAHTWAWKVSIDAHGTKRHLGYFRIEDLEKAIEARKIAEAELHGEYARKGEWQ